MLSNEKNSVINIGSDKEISILELANLIMTKMNLEPNFEFLPERKGDHTRRCPDITKLKNIVGDYNFISLEKGIELQYEKYGFISNSPAQFFLIEHENFFEDSVFK